MFQYAYQGGNFIEILDVKGAKDKNEDKLFKVNNPHSLVKVYDKTIKSYLYELDGGIKTKLQFPRDEKQELDSFLTLETIITDTSKNKRRLIFTTSVKEIERTHFHIKIPLESLKKGVWVNLSFDLVSFFCLFSGSTFRSFDGFIMGGACKIRKIFTMKNPITDFSTGEEETNLPYISEYPAMNKILGFTSGIIYTNQLITFNDMQKNLSEVKSLSPRSRAHSNVKSETGSLQLSNTFGTYLKKKEKETFSPINKPKRNISLQISENLSTKEAENKENSNFSITPVRTLESGTSCVLSTAETQASYKIGRRFFFSPRNDQSQEKQQKSSNKIEEPPLSRNQSFSNRKVSAPRFPAGSFDERSQGNGPEEKKKVIRLLIKNSSPEKNLTRAQELLEVGSNKLSFLKKKLELKNPSSAYLFTELSPKTGQTPSLSISTVKNKSEKNPWNYTETSLAKSKPSKFNFDMNPENPVKVKGSSGVGKKTKNFGDKLEKQRLNEVSKDNSKIPETPSKDYSYESERFSTFYKSRDDRPLSNYKDNNDSQRVANLNDDIESIDENLEYEINSNTSGVCGSSRNLLDYRNKMNNGLMDQEGDMIIERRSTRVGTPELYRMFTMKNDGKDESQENFDHMEKASMRFGKRTEMEEGKAKNVLNQLEAKVKNIVSNSRPYSPPFASNIGADHRPKKGPEKEYFAFSSGEKNSLSKKLTNHTLESESGNNPLFHDFYLKTNN